MFLIGTCQLGGVWRYLFLSVKQHKTGVTDKLWDIAEIVKLPHRDSLARIILLAFSRNWYKLNKPQLL
jgi:hypothetical protein